jgi:hypothetical protein
MKLTTTTFVSVDGVVQGIGGPDEDRSGGFEHGGWTTPLRDNEAGTFLNQVYQARRLIPVQPAHLRDLRQLMRSSGRSGHQSNRNGI